MAIFFQSTPNVQHRTLVSNPQYASSSLRKWPQTSALLLKAKTPLCQTLPLTHQQVLPSLAPKQVLNLFPFHCWYSLPPWATTFVGLRRSCPWEAARSVYPLVVGGPRLWLIGRMLMGSCPWVELGGDVPELTEALGICPSVHRTAQGPWESNAHGIPSAFDHHTNSSFGQLWLEPSKEGSSEKCCPRCNHVDKAHRHPWPPNLKWPFHSMRGAHC